MKAFPVFPDKSKCKPFQKRHKFKTMFLKLTCENSLKMNSWFRSKNYNSYDYSINENQYLQKMKSILV